ncbi:MAG TPA: hypothetical protein VFV89_05980 [Nocardioides sp.]|uniref:hypothetical protein n=1 Tax=Nocardioides sp. TaxID=35761 RepID=UPI002E2F9775|nr:hypothetical protein [Nocardioides sp.]HEX5087337.1 hypothetical protein [Nocardioides sp.]
MYLTVDAFHALARSSPWRWRSLHLRHRSDAWTEGVEAWIVRPGWMLARAPGLDDLVVQDSLRTPATTWFSTDPDFVPPPPPVQRWAMDVAPSYRPDGLVDRRPQDWAVQYDDPMFNSYLWVAMLDPEELSHHVAITDLHADDRLGRETWWASVRALEGYEARCPDCCDLLLGGATQGVEHVVGLDVQTGVLVSLRAPEVRDRDWFVENEILAVDDDVVAPPVATR